MKILYVIAALQDYEYANHVDLWNSMVKQEGVDIVVANLAADRIVKRIKGEHDIIRDAKSKPVRISDHLTVVRPLVLIHPKRSIGITDRMVARQFWKCIERAIRLEDYDEIRLIVYEAYWGKVLYRSVPGLKMGYYLYDEVRRDGRKDKINWRRTRDDKKCCAFADCIFTMSDRLRLDRREFEDKMHLVGNGATANVLPQIYRLPATCAFFGHFRDWIDFDLLDEVIAGNPDITFYFVGTVEGNVRGEMKRILSNHPNACYCGMKPKALISSIYAMFDVVIVPYRQNHFCTATRPIKIVEAVFSGTPVVSVPVDGYRENSFIRFARTAGEFSEQIRRFIGNPIDTESGEYWRFLQENSWDAKAGIIDRAFSGVK